MHRKGIMHRDIKAENMLITGEGVLKLCDFGWSTYIPDNDSLRHSYCGTYENMPPEMVLRKGHDKTLDVWCLGTLLYRMLAGKPNFDGYCKSTIFEKILEN